MQRQSSDQELAESFTVAPDEMALIVDKSGTGRLGFALMLKYFQRDGRFPASLTELGVAGPSEKKTQLGAARYACFVVDRFAGC